jgi:hypothetical protein
MMASNVFPLHAGCDCGFIRYCWQRDHFMHIVAIVAGASEKTARCLR